MADIGELVKRLGVRWEATSGPTVKKINRMLLERKEAACALTALEEENKALREALEPFSAATGHFDGYVQDDDDVSIALRSIKARHLRAARRALASREASS